jgi:hypothetical protein
MHHAILGNKKSVGQLLTLVVEALQSPRNKAKQRPRHGMSVKLSLPCFALKIWRFQQTGRCANAIKFNTFSPLGCNKNNDKF